MKDGMEITLFTLNNQSLMLQYAAVRSQIYIGREGAIIQLKGDTHPIGEPFSATFQSYGTRTFQLMPHDRVFAFSDGFVDQFGGPNHKRFLSSRFRALLIQHQQTDLPELRTALQSAFETWQGSEEQYDDVLVFGLQIGSLSPSGL
jgi:phosphoserine phosphatase RsbU/P